MFSGNNLFLNKGGLSMEKQWIVIWSDSLITGHKEIDDFHKEILDDVVELYKMIDDSAKFKNEIPKLTDKIEKNMFIHMDTEISLFKKINMPGWEEHEENHNLYKEEYDFFRDYILSPVIRAVFTGETASKYMRDHFPMFDMKDIPKIVESREEPETNDN